LKWGVLYDSGDQDIAKCVAVDSSGNVYVAGYWEVSDGQNRDYRTIKYSQI
jgi:hypothetical protein